MKTTLLAAFILAFVLPVLGAEQKLPKLTTTDGTSYTDVTIIAVYSSGVRIAHDSGLATIPWTQIPPDIRRSLGYNPQKPTAPASTPDPAKPAIAASSSQQAIPPQKPIEVRSEIGETATTSDKVHIAIHALVTPQDVACSVVIQDTQFLGGEFRIAPAEIGDFATLVQTASDKLLAGQSFSGKTPNTAVEVSNKEGELALTISFERKGFSMSTSSITMDADNAATLARLVTRARQTIDWLAPRLRYIQPTKP